MRYQGRADSVRVVGDEDGYHLVIETDEGDRMDFRMSHDVAEDLAFAQTVGVRLHFEEGQNARATYAPPIDPAAYDARDPKNPEFVDALEGI